MTGKPFLRLARACAGLCVLALAACAGTPELTTLRGPTMGTAWSVEMRNMMILSFIAYLAAVFALPPYFGNHGLWAALNLFLLMRGITLAAILPGKERKMFG